MVKEFLQHEGLKSDNLMNHEYCVKAKGSKKIEQYMSESLIRNDCWKMV